MRAYLTRLYQVPFANLLFNKSTPLGSREILADFSCFSGWTRAAPMVLHAPSLIPLPVRRGGRSELMPSMDPDTMAGGQARGQAAAGIVVGRTVAPPLTALLCSARQLPHPASETNKTGGKAAWQQPATLLCFVSEHTKLLARSHSTGSQSSSSGVGGHRVRGGEMSAVVSSRPVHCNATAGCLEAAKTGYSWAVAKAAALREAALASGRGVGRRFALTSEGFLKWALWRQNVSVAFESSW
jgi:hypothetical protein